MLSLLLIACVLSLSSGQGGITPLMSGRFVSVDIYPNAAESLKAFSAVWNDPTEWKVAGYYVNSSPLCDGNGLRLTFEGFEGHFDLNFEEEILTDKWTRGMVEETKDMHFKLDGIEILSSVRNTVEELGVEETK